MLQTDTIFCDTTALPFYQMVEPYEMTGDVEVNTGIPLDSIFRPYDTPDTIYRATIFTGHRLAPQHNTLLQRPTTALPAWVFAFIIATCALLCLYYRNHKLQLGEMMRTIFEGSSPDKMIRGTIQGMALLPIMLLLSGSIGMVIWIMAMQKTGILGYLLLTLALSAAYLLRNGLLSALASVFDQGNTMNAYITSNYAFHLILSTLVAPLLFGLAYIPGAGTALAIAIGALAALTFLMRFLNGCKLFLTKSKTFSFFLFYYLCSVEIIPFLVVLKWIISQ